MWLSGGLLLIAEEIERYKSLHLHYSICFLQSVCQHLKANIHNDVITSNPLNSANKLKWIRRRIECMTQKTALSSILSHLLCQHTYRRILYLFLAYIKNQLNTKENRSPVCAKKIQKILQIEEFSVVHFR